MILQFHEVKAPIPKDIRPGDLVQWAGWYMRHLMAGGKKLDGTPLNG